MFGFRTGMQEMLPLSFITRNPQQQAEARACAFENNTMVKNCHLRLPQEAVNEDWTIYLRAVATCYHRIYRGSR